MTTDSETIDKNPQDQRAQALRLAAQTGRGISTIRDKAGSYSAPNSLVPPGQEVVVDLDSGYNQTQAPSPSE